MYTENCKMLWEKNKDHAKKWKDILCSWSGKIKIVKMFLLHKMMYGFSVTPMKIPGFPGGSVVQNIPAGAGDVGSTPDWEEPLEKEMAIYSRILAWKSHKQRQLVGSTPWGHKGVGLGLATK